MSGLKVGDIVTRKSYGGDIYFTIADIKQNADGKPTYVLKGIFHRIEADSNADDLIKPSRMDIDMHMHRHVVGARNFALRRSFYKRSYFMNRLRSKPGKILHVDSSKEFLNMCIDHYKESRLQPIGVLAGESEQPGMIRRLLEKNRPDILVVTGHDALKKDAAKNSLESYRNSRYFIQSVKEARSYEPDKDRLSVFAGACQSYFEAIMSAGANYASSPGRVLINALDPAFVSEKIALTDSREVVTPEEIAGITVSGGKGIGGIRTKGHMVWI